MLPSSFFRGVCSSVCHIDINRWRQRYQGWLVVKCYCEYNVGVLIFTPCRKSLTQSDNHNQVVDKGKGDGFGTSQPGDGDDHEQTHNNEENDFGGKNSKNRAKNNQTSSEMKKEYFEYYKGDKMTVVFHAVLAPHFKFEPNLGDKIYMRFGGAMFGDFLDNVVEVVHHR